MASTPGTVHSGGRQMSKFIVTGYPFHFNGHWGTFLKIDFVVITIICIKDLFSNDYSYDYDGWWKGLN